VLVVLLVFFGWSYVRCWCSHVVLACACDVGVFFLRERA
jgi:hypothetical protein